MNGKPKKRSLYDYFSCQTKKTKSEETEHNEVNSSENVTESTDISTERESSENEDAEPREESMSIQPNNLMQNVEESPAKSLWPEDTVPMTEEIETLFAPPKDVIMHNFYKCMKEHCQNLSAQERSRLRTGRDRFVHSWLLNNKLNSCPKTGLAWLVYQEGRGMFCYLCKKHNTENQQNKSKVFSATPCVRLKKSAIQDHGKSQQHKDAIEAEMLGRVSVFHKEVQERKLAKADVMLKASMAAYWLVKEEVSNRKMPSLVNLLKVLGYDEMKHFQYSSQGSTREIFLALGSTLLGNLLEKVKKAYCFGLLTDEVTDVSVQEMLITFIQFFDYKTGNIETSFLFIEDVLKNSTSANAETIFTVLTNKLNKLGLELKDCSSLVSDGAAVMTGQRNGVASRLKVVNPHLISLHCLCHKLALACTDTSSQIEYINNVELWLRQLWKLFDNSPKRIAIYLKVQMNLKSLDLSEKSKKIVAKKIKKACHTRWLSFDAATRSIHDDFEAVLQTLRQLKDSDAVAAGLLSKVASFKFIGTIYIFREVLPVLSSLSKNFQRGHVNFSHIQPSVNYTVHKLNDIAESKSPLVAVKRDLKGRLSTCELNWTPDQENQLLGLLENYIKALKKNIHSRFDGDLPIVSAFSIFNPLTLPAPGTSSFKEYGGKQVKTLADHFYQGHEEENAKKEQLLAEWEKFKFDMDSWKKDIPEGMDKSHLETATEWCLKRLITLKTAYSAVFPALASIAEVCLSMPVSNAWPERGCSALKRTKTRLRNRIGVDMLQTLLMISINGPPVGTPECKALITTAVEKWQTQRKRKNCQKGMNGSHFHHQLPVQLQLHTCKVIALK